MRDHGTQQCAICGEDKLAGQVWLLVAESHCEDKLKVLQWQDELARRHGIYAACCPNHVQELVVHWMTTGSLDYPFATVGAKPATPQTSIGLATCFAGGSRHPRRPADRRIGGGP